MADHKKQTKRRKRGWMTSDERQAAIYAADYFVRLGYASTTTHWTPKSNIIGAYSAGFIAGMREARSKNSKVSRG